MRRTITRLAIVGTALCSIVLISFPSFPSTLGIISKPILVDRTLKGDRLSNTSAPTNRGLSRDRRSCEPKSVSPWAVIALLVRCRDRIFRQSSAAAWCDCKPCKPANARQFETFLGGSQNNF